MMMGRYLPANTDIDRCPLVPRREEPITLIHRTNDRGAVRIREDGVVEPHSTSKPPKHNVRTWFIEAVPQNLRVRVRLAAIFKRQTGLHPGHKTVRARLLGHNLLEVLHAAVHAHGRGGKGPIADLDALGLVLGEELRFQDRDVGICDLRM